METSLMIAIICAVFSAFAVVVTVGLLVVGLLIHRANQKMYTEYFKDRSIAARK